MSDDNKRKRQSGTGSITKRKDGLWTARIMIGYTSTGTPRIKALYGRSEAEVRRKLREYKDEADKTNGVVIARNTVRAYMESWLQSNKRNTLKPKSYDRLEQTLEHQVFPHIGQLQLAALQASDVQKMLNDLATEGFSYSSIKKAYDAVNDCFRTGVIQKTVVSNPALGVTIPKSSDSGTEHDLRFYTDEEVDLICQAALKTYKNSKRMYRLGDAIVLDVNTGLRLSELVGLRWDNVSIENKDLYVGSTVVMAKDRSNPDGKVVPLQQNTTKSRAGRRHVPLNEAAVAALTRLKEVTGDTPYVIATSTGNLVLPRFVDRMFRNILKTAGFSDDRIFGIHALRHTFATRLLKSGVDIKTVSVILGHSDITVTYNTYIHVIEEQKRDAVAKAAT